MFSDCHNTVAPRAGAAPPPPPPTQAVLGKKTSFILVGSEMKEKNERSLGHWFHSALSYLRTWSSPMYSRMGLYLYQQSLSRLHEGKGEKLFLSHGLKVIISTFKWILYNCKILCFWKETLESSYSQGSLKTLMCSRFTTATNTDSLCICLVFITFMSFSEPGAELFLLFFF